MSLHQPQPPQTAPPTEADRGQSGPDPHARAKRLLGMAKQAGAVAVGVEGVRSLCRSGRARLVLIASDCSDNSKKRIADCCAFYKVQLVPLSLTMGELGHATGAGDTAAVAVRDAGLARAIHSSLPPGKQPDEGGY